MSHLRIGLCQLNTKVGDLDGNAARVLTALEAAEGTGCELAIFPEMAITGYPPEDLLLKPRFVADNLEALEKVAARTDRCVAVVGFVDAGRDLANAAAVCAHGKVQGVYHKRLLPNYGVFDEQRYFAPSAKPLVLFVIGGVRVGISLCEDAWSPDGPVAEQAAGGAELVVNLSASPYHAGRLAERERMLATRAADASCSLVYVNQVGGQDELVFDGASMVFDAHGNLVARAPQFIEAVSVVDIDVPPLFRKRLLDPRGRGIVPALPEVVVTGSAGGLLASSARDEGSLGVADAIIEPLSPTAEVYEALVVATRDYVHKNGFSDVVIGLSGGVDSSLVAAVAVDALGAGHVHGVSLPSRFSSQGSRDDAAELGRNLGIEIHTIPIEPAHAALREMLKPFLSGEASPSGLSGPSDPSDDVTDQNLQARARGTVLMALSNRFGWMVLTTGNKSELAVGFATLYGDMAGGFAVLKDVTKTLVYRLCAYRNDRAGRALIPESVLTKPPSAELRPNQRDDQTLPPYELLDPVLEAYVEGDMTATELEEAGFDPTLVRRVVTLVDRAEYKRRQAPPGVRVTPKAFGKDRRLPIVNGYRG